MASRSFVVMRESIKGCEVGEVDGPNQVETNRLW